MILCYPHIKKAFTVFGWKAYRDGELITDTCDLKINPNSINVTLGNKALFVKNLKDNAVDPRRADSIEWDEWAIPDALRLNPGGFCLTHVRERFECSEPLFIEGRARWFIPMIEGRSTLARCGLSVHQTAGFGDVGFSSNFTLELSTRLPIVLRPGDAIAQVYFIEASSAAMKYSGAYQSQNDAPRAPLLGQGRV